MVAVHTRRVWTRAVAGAAVLVSVVTAASAASAATRYVTAGGDLQAALNAAQPGDEIVLTAGARYTGVFRLPLKPAGPVITIRSSAVLPARRITPDDASLLPTIVSGTVESAITATGTSNWRLDGLRFESNALGEGTIIVLHDATNITLDRLLIVAGAQGQKRAIMGNGRQITLTRSHIANIWMSGVDSQAFAAWDGAGPYTITDNYLEAASENVLFGGADSAAPDRIPSDILVTNNHMSKRLEWKGQPRNVKNLFELKAARRVVVRNNLFERNWTDGQAGVAILFTPRNQDGRAPWTVVEDVLFEHNIIRDTEGVFNVLGHDDERPSARTTRITIRHNLAIGSGTFVLAGGEVGVLTIDHNTVNQRGNFATLFYGDIAQPDGFGTRPAQFAVESLTITNTLANHNTYGLYGDTIGVGTKALTLLVRNWTWTHNVLAGEAGWEYSYPAVTWQPTTAQHQAQFTATYELVASSTYHGSATDGQDLGVLWTTTTPPPPPQPPLPPPSSILIVTANPLAVGTVGKFYMLLFKADMSGSWAVTGGALPPGMSMSAAGLLVGTPTRSGMYKFQVTVRNSTLSGTGSFELRIRPQKPGGLRVVR